VVPRALGVMAREGAAVDRVEALVGPGICADHYEVPADLRDAVDAAVPGTGAATGDGRPALDLAAGIVAQLRDAGVAGWDVLPECTYETPHLYSYRRDGTTGRFAGLVWIQP
jgi:copper oxidase (laccase) domain-containing protein